VSTGLDPHHQRERWEASRKKVEGFLEEIARLSESDPEPAAYYDTFLKKVLATLNAPAAAVWMTRPEGELQLHAQAHWPPPDLANPAACERHATLLRQALQQGHPIYVPPEKVLDAAVRDSLAPASPNLLLAPIRVGYEARGLLEVCLPSSRHSQAIPGYVQLMAALAELVGRYLHQQDVRETARCQQLWTELERFARQVHASLHITEVAYLVANEARRLIGCDRMSVALRRGRRVDLEAVSGVDVIDPRANVAQRLRALVQRVLVADTLLVYTGVPDPSQPPAVLEALDRYLAESPSKLLAVAPVRDERERDRLVPARAALVLECFEPLTEPKPLLERLEIVGRHAASALFNASEYRRIPCAWLWQPLVRLQEGLGGRARASLFLVLAAVATAVATLVTVPCPLKLEAKGQLLPAERRRLYSAVEGQVVRFDDSVQPGSQVVENQALVLMYDAQLEIKLGQLASEIDGAQQAIEALARQETGAASEADALRLAVDKRQREFLRDRKLQERQALCERLHADESRPGNFWLVAPLSGTILSADFRESLTSRWVKPNEPLLRIGDKSKPWEIQLKIPQAALGHVSRALAALNSDEELDVDIKLQSCPTRTFKGKLSQGRIASQALPDRDEVSGAEPVVMAWVRLEGSDINPEECVPGDLLVTGTEVHARIRCGRHALGYCLFHGVWEFVADKLSFLD
jgi:hypothetical protein